MSGTIFALVLAAAALHAAWNALVRSDADKTTAMVAVVVGQGLFGALALPFAPAAALASAPYIALSIALHVGYQAFLLMSYRQGGLTQVYPVARGSAPLIVAVASVLFLGETLTAAQMLAVAVIAFGVMSLSLANRGLAVSRAGGLALITGMFIAGYSLCDGHGARVAGSAVAYYSWESVVNTVIFAAYFQLRRPGAIRRCLAAWRLVLIGGGASFLAYVLVVYAFTQAPIPLVTALRETSIVFALAIGVFGLKERVDLVRALSIFMTVFGAALLRLTRG